MDTNSHFIGSLTDTNTDARRRQRPVMEDIAGSPKTNSNRATHRCTGPGGDLVVQKKLGRAFDRESDLPRLPACLPDCLPSPLSLFVPDFRHCSGH